MPQSRHDIGEIKLANHSERAPKRISLKQLALRETWFAADPNLKHFEFPFVSGEVEDPLREVLRDPVPGLNRRSINVFSSNNSQYQVSSNALEWGDSYYFVWSDPDFAPIEWPGSLIVGPASQLNNWYCALVTLPNSPDPATTEWLKVNCDLNTIHHNLRLAVLPPQTVYRDSAGSFVLPTADPVLICVLPGTDSQGEISHTLRITYRDQHEESTVGTDAATLLRLEIPERTAQLYLDGARTISFLSKDFPNKKQLETSRVDIVYRTATGAHEVSALHSRHANETIRAARRKRIELISLAIPRDIEGMLRSRRINETRWTKTTLIPSSAQSTTSVGNYLLDDEVAQFLEDCIADRETEIEIDFGSLGQIALRAEFENYQQFDSLSPRMRAQIILALNRAGIYAGCGSIPREPSAVNDADLVCLLQSLPAKYRQAALATSLISTLKKERSS